MALTLAWNVIAVIAESDFIDISRGLENETCHGNRK